MIPLANPARSREADGSSNVTAPTSPWAAMAAGRKRNISGVMSVIGRNAVQARVLLFASAHQCEEFWYTNVPDALVNSSSGTCGGGPYRELEARHRAASRAYGPVRNCPKIAFSGAR